MKRFSGNRSPLPDWKSPLANALRVSNYEYFSADPRISVVRELRLVVFINLYEHLTAMQMANSISDSIKILDNRVKLY
jgi:hypothetical protein